MGYGRAQEMAERIALAGCELERPDGGLLRLRSYTAAGYGIISIGKARE